MLTELHIGIDDTDSILGGCTTYTAAVIFEELWKRGFVPADFPWLVRLNPNIPWKTRGNGALALHFFVEENRLAEAREVALQVVERTTDPSIPSTDPAVVFLTGKIPTKLTAFSTKALCEVIRVSEARQISRVVKADSHLFKGSRGLVGALAAMGADLDKDHTFEIVAYRTKDNLGTPRRIDADSVREMDAKFQHRTFNNLDPETGRVLISPHGPDPVLFGIRGEDPLSLTAALQCVRVREPIERVMIFKTNHGTDAHLAIQRKIQDLRPYQAAVVTGRVETVPYVLKGGHVIFRLDDGTGVLDCAAYEPTGPFRKIARELIPGDRMKVSGGIRCGPNGSATLNLEKLEVLELAEKVHWKNPCCTKCDYRCESMGHGQGYRCRKCGLRYPPESVRTVVEERRLRETVYIPPPRANRHLTKPASRYISQRIPTRDRNSSPPSIDDGFLALHQVFSLENP